MTFFERFAEPVRSALGRMLAEDFEEVLDRLPQPGLVAFDRQNIIGPLLANGLRNAGLGSHGVDRDHAALQGQGGQQLRNGRLFIGLCPGGLLPQDQSGVGRKGTDQMQRRLTGLGRTTAGFAIQGHHLGRESGQHRLDPAPEGGLEGLRLDQPEEPGKGVVRRNAVGQFQVATKPRQLLPSPGLDLFEGIGTDQNAADGDGQGFGQGVRTLLVCGGSAREMNTSVMGMGREGMCRCSNIPLIQSCDHDLKCDAFASCDCPVTHTNEPPEFPGAVQSPPD